MAATARVVEYVGVAAYLGAANLISDPVLLTSAASILTIEARHQTILNALNGGTAIPQAFDIAFSPQQVLAVAAPFISGCDVGVTGAFCCSTQTYPYLTHELLSQPYPDGHQHWRHCPRHLALVHVHRLERHERWPLLPDDAWR